MKNIIIILTCALTIFLFSGCKHIKTSSEIEIYTVSRDFFNSFLESPSMDMLDSNKLQRFVYSKGDRWHIRNGATRFELRESFIDFVGNEAELKKFLAKNEMVSDFQNVVIIDAPNVPLTIWVDTVEEDVYVTINVESDGEYTYKCYTACDYVDEYGLTYAALNINGIDVGSANPSKIYSNYAEVPFITVLESLGATFSYQADRNIEICFNERLYILNIDKLELYETGKEKTNMLNKDGGYVFVYPDGNELMIDSFTLNTVLRMMDEPITITCDKANKVVLINQQ